MKNRYILSALCLLLLSISSCDKGFVEENKNPVLATTIDPVYQLVTTEIIGIDIVHYEAPIVQHA